jgi:hypothetical protein
MIVKLHFSNKFDLLWLTSLFLYNLREYSFDKGNRTQTFKHKQCNYRYCQLLQRNPSVVLKHNFLFMKKIISVAFWIAMPFQWCPLYSITIKTYCSNGRHDIHHNDTQHNIKVIATFSIMTLNALCWMSFMLSAIYAECCK